MHRQTTLRFRAAVHVHAGAWLALCFLLACADTHERKQERPSTQSRENDAGIAALDTTTCDDVEQEAQQLRDEARRCSAGDECVMMAIEARCLVPLLCPIPINRSADLDHLASEAARLTRAYAECTNTCAFANCRYTAGTPGFCNEITQHCEDSPTPGDLARD